MPSERKIRRRAFEQRVGDFVDAAEFIVDRPWLLWAPGVGSAAKALMKAVAKAKQRSQA